MECRISIHSKPTVPTRKMCWIYFYDRFHKDFVGFLKTLMNYRFTSKILDRLIYYYIFMKHIASCREWSNILWHHQVHTISDTKLSDAVCNFMVTILCAARSHNLVSTCAPNFGWTCYFTFGIEGCPQNTHFYDQSRRSSSETYVIVKKFDVMLGYCISFASACF
jgi:hypothetical protein